MPSVMERAARRAARSAVRGRGLASLFAAALATVALVVVDAAPVAAHGETFFQLGAEQVRPGGSVELRADLGAGDSFDVSLVSKTDGARRLVATLRTSDEGHLQTYLTIPADLPAGDYIVEVAYDLTVMRATLTVVGAPITGDDGERPGQDEGIGLVPSSGGAAPQPTAGAPGPERVAPGRADRSPTDGLSVVLGASMAAGSLLVVLRVLVRRRRRASG